jgi:hypothetical protein
MSLLGKVLAVLNVLAAAAFFYLMAVDYGVHHRWAYTAFRFGLTLNGPPVDANVTGVQGVKEVEDIDPQTENKLKQVGGQPLKTQEEEVKRVQGILQQQIDSPEPLTIKDPELKQVIDAAQKRVTATDEESVRLQTLLRQPPAGAQEQVKGLQDKVLKIQKLAYLLEPFATTFARRDGLIRLMAAGIPLPETPFAFNQAFGQQIQKTKQKYARDRQNPTTLLNEQDEIASAVVQQLQDEFAGQFTTALEKRDPGEKHEAIAHLLFGLARAQRDDEGPEQVGLFQSKAYQRVLTVVGLEAAVKELDTETPILERMVAEADLAIERDRLNFAREQEQRLQQVAMLKQDYTRAEAQRRAKEREVETQTELVNTQKTNVERVTRALAQAQEDTKKMLEEQKTREQQIFAKQGALRNALEQIKALEKRLRDLEEKVR